MAICTEACCNVKARDAIRAQRLAAFEAYLAERDATRAPEPVIAERADAADHDLTYAEAVASHVAAK